MQTGSHLVRRLGSWLACEWGISTACAMERKVLPFAHLLGSRLGWVMTFELVERSALQCLGG